MSKNKKGQEEMMGFVLIVLILIIIGVVFFAFALRRGGENIWQHSSEADDLLNTMLSYTTPHTIGGKNLSVRELLKECAAGDGGCCQEANTTLYLIFGALELNVSGRFIHGYNLTATVDGDKLDNFGFAIGNQTGSSFISSVPIPGSPQIEVKLRCWYPRK